MKTTLKLTNADIFAVAITLKDLCENPDFVLPIKANFYLQKNKATFLSLAQEIEESRTAIFEKYGTLNEDKTGYSFKEDVIAEANAELDTLLTLIQELDVYMIDLDDFKDIKLNSQQMNVLMLMINEIE